MADPLSAEPEEALVDATLPSERAVRLLHRRDFRRTYSAVVISELGDAFQYVALMWFALVAAHWASSPFGWPTVCPRCFSACTAGSLRTGATGGRP